MVCSAILCRSEKGGLKKTSPGYSRSGIFSRLGGRGGEGESGERGGGGGGGVFGRLSWGRGEGGGGGGGGGGSRNQWHKVTIPRGGNQDQEQLISTLQSGMDAPLQPVNVSTLPYSAYISQVFNFANFVNLESFAKFIQLQF